MRRLALFFVFMLFVALSLAFNASDLSGDKVWAASAHSPRRSGLEPPGGPRQLDSVPQGRAMTRSYDGGMGYTDAYGNTVDDVPPEERAPRRRLRAGAYGAYGRDKADTRPLPDPAPGGEGPAWSIK